MSNPYGTTSYYANAAEAARHAAADTMKATASAAGDSPAEWISALSGAVSAVAAVGTFATDLSALILRSDEKDPTAVGGSLQISVTNLTSVAVVLSSYEPDSGDVSNTVDPLGPGESDVFLMTRPGDQFVINETTIDLEFFVGDATSAVPVAIRYFYSDGGSPGRWKVQASIGDDPMQAFPAELQLMGASLKGDGYPSFSFYTMPIETGSGALGLRFLDYAG